LQRHFGGPCRERIVWACQGSLYRRFERHIGRFELADGGTIFLDEIGELPLGTQVKLFARSSGA